jgi:hypothetical protein
LVPTVDGGEDAVEVGGRRLDVVLTVRERRDGEYHYSRHANRAASADPKLQRLDHFEDGGAAAGTNRAPFNIQPLTSAVEPAQRGMSLTRGMSGVGNT